MSTRSICGILGTVGFALLVALRAPAADGPYTDPRLLDVPWGKYSFARPAWRGYLETVPAVDYLDGLGVVWNASVPNESVDRMAADLEWAGFRRVRIEVPWGAVSWDERGFDGDGEARLVRMLKALRAHHLRPLILLNANHLQPCPVQWRDVVLRVDAPQGGRSIVVTGDLRDVGSRPTTIMSLADIVTAGPLLDGAPSGKPPTLALAKGLPRALRAGETLRLAILKYPPLADVGTREFEETAAGWLRYVDLVTALVARHYGPEFDVEIWNEYTFGSAYLSIDNYREPRSGASSPEPFHQGGRIWELAHRTVERLQRDHAGVDAIWGFSNTSFFHVAIPELPPGIAGQSYHPYGTGRRCYADVVKNREALLLDDRMPQGCIVEPEGWAHTWYQTESLVRLLAPVVRTARPPGSPTFRHFITEHGFKPAELDMTDREAAARAKQKFLLRAPLLWLNKGISGLYVYNAYEADDLGFGMLRADGTVSQAMRSLHELTARLADAVPVAAPRPLHVEVRPAVPGGPAAAAADRVAVLPFQVAEGKFALGVYVMTQDFPADLVPQRYIVSVSGVRGRGAAVTYFSPESANVEPVTVRRRGDSDLDVDIALTDVPRLLEIDERPDSAAATGAAL